MLGSKLANDTTDTRRACKINPLDGWISDQTLDHRGSISWRISHDVDDTSRETSFDENLTD